MDEGNGIPSKGILGLLFPALAPIITLCITLACLTKPRLWGIYPNSPLCGREGLVSPHTSIVPEIVFTSPAIVFNKVDFPTPEGPAIATISPGKISRFGILTKGSSFLYPINTSFKRTIGSC